MCTAQENLYGGRWQLSTLSVSCAYVEQYKLRIWTKLFFTTFQHLKFSFSIFRKQLFCLLALYEKFNKDFPKEGKLVNMARNCKNIFWFLW